MFGLGPELHETLENNESCPKSKKLTGIERNLAQWWLRRSIIASNVDLVQKSLDDVVVWAVCFIFDHVVESLSRVVK